MPCMTQEQWDWCLAEVARCGVSADLLQWATEDGAGALAKTVLFAWQCGEGQIFPYVE